MLCIIMCLVSIPAYAANDILLNNKLLFVSDFSTYSLLIEELNDPAVILDEDNVSDYSNSETDIAEAIVADFDVFDCISSEKATNELISTYGAVALPVSSKYTAELAQNAYKGGKIVYLYGTLTIEDYKNTLLLNDFSLRTNIYSSDETKSELVNQGFDSSFENSEIYNVICYSNNALLCKFNSEARQVHYLAAAANNFSKNINEAKTCATIVKSQFDFTTYWGPNNECVSHMDYTLYRETNETDPTYDYFAIKTTTWATGAGKVKKLQTKYTLPYSNDNLLETGPESQSNIGTLSVGIGFGKETVSGSIGYSYNLSDQRPTIKRTENLSNDTVEWILGPRTLIPKNIDDAKLICVASWASTGKTAAIDAYYTATLGIGPQEIPTSPGYTKVPIRFSYSN